MNQLTSLPGVFAEVVLAPATVAAVLVEPPYRDGLLPNTAASAPVEVTIPWNDEFVSSDTLQLFWDGVEAGTLHTITDDEELAAAPVKLSLPLAAGDNNDLGPKVPHKLRYRLHGYYSNRDVDSPAINLYVDRTAPGGGLLGELELPGIVGPNFVVTPDKLDGSGQLVARVPSYGGQFEGDRIVPQVSRDGGTTWTPLTASEIRLPAGASENTDVTIYFPLSDLLALGDGIRLLSYFVTDRAGNRSLIDGQPRPVTLLLTDVPADSDLLEPVVPLYADGIVNEADARQLTATVPKFAHANVGDTVQLFWNDVSVAILRINDIAPDPILTFPISYPLVVSAGNGAPRYEADVRYTVARLGYPVASSPVLEDVLVDLTLPGGPDPDPGTPGYESLVSPWIVGENGTDRNIIYANQYGKDARITVPWPAGAAGAAILQGDVVQVTYGTFNLAPYTISAADATNKVDLPFTLTGPQMETEGSGIQPLKYTVTRRFAAAGSVPEYSNTVASEIVDVTVIGADEIPGGGTSLPNGEFVNLNAQGALDWNNTRQGARYRIFLNYANVAPQDHIYVKFIGYRPRTSANVTPGSTFEIDAEIAQTDISRGEYIFTIPASHFTLDNFPRISGLGHSHYIVNRSGGTGNAPETAPTNRVPVDLLNAADTVANASALANTPLDSGNYTQLQARLSASEVKGS